MAPQLEHIFHEESCKNCHDTGIEDPFRIPRGNEPCSFCNQNHPGNIKVIKNSTTTTVTISGNFHCNLESSKRDSLLATLQSAHDSQYIVLKLSNISRLDFWGCKSIANVIDDVIANRKNCENMRSIAIIIHGNYSQYLTELSNLLKHHGESVIFSRE